MADIISVLGTVGKTLFGLREALSKARKERKQAVADFLAGIAQTIEGTAAQIRQSTYPHGTCQELLSHSQNMVAAIGDLVGQQQAQDLAAQLREVWEIEQLYGELMSSGADQRSRKLETLDQTAGLFRATAAFVRVSP